MMETQTTFGHFFGPCTIDFFHAEQSGSLHNFCKTLSKSVVSTKTTRLGPLHPFDVTPCTFKTRKCKRYFVTPCVFNIMEWKIHFDFINVLCWYELKNIFVYRKPTINGKCDTGSE